MMVAALLAFALGGGWLWAWLDQAAHRSAQRDRDGT